MTNAIFLKILLNLGLGLTDEELIIPEWFFKTTIVIEPERIEFLL